MCDVSEQVERDLQLLREKSLFAVSTLLGKELKYQIRQLEMNILRGTVELAQEHFADKILRNLAVTTVVEPSTVFLLHICHIDTINFGLIRLTKKTN